MTLSLSKTLELKQGRPEEEIPGKKHVFKTCSIMFVHTDSISNVSIKDLMTTPLRHPKRIVMDVTCN